MRLPKVDKIQFQHLMKTTIAVITIFFVFLRVTTPVRIMRAPEKRRIKITRYDFKRDQKSLFGLLRF